MKNQIASFAEKYVKPSSIFISIFLILSFIHCSAPSDQEQATTHSLTIDVTGVGHVTSLPAGIDCPGHCHADFEIGTTVSLQANPSRQVHWWSQKNYNSSYLPSGNLSIKMDKPQEISARFSPSWCNDSGFCAYNPIAEGHNIRGMARVAGQGTWLVGDEGTILFFDGKRLTAIDSPRRNDLYAVAASRDGRVIWAVGRAGIILTFNGTNWVEISTSNSQRNDLFRGVWISDSGLHAWIVGSNGLVFEYQSQKVENLQQGQNLVYTIFKPNPRKLSDLYAIWGNAEEDVYVAGTDRAVFHYNSISGQWDPQGIPSGYTDLAGVWGKDHDLVLVGKGGAAIHGQTDQNPVPFFGEANQTSQDLYTVWGNQITDLWGGGYGGTLIHRDSSQSWSIMKFPTDLSIFAGSIVENRKGPDKQSSVSIISGEAGLLGLYNPSEWTRLEGPFSLFDVFAGSPEDVWAVGEKITHISNGIATVLPTDNDAFYLHGIWGSSTTDIWTVGNDGTILHSTDGKSFTRYPSPTTKDLYAICGNSMAGVINMWAVGESGTILHSDGKTWSLFTEAMGVTEDLNGLWCGKTGEVWMVGNQGRALHYDGKNIQNLNLGRQYRLDSIGGDSQGNLYVVGAYEEDLRKGIRLYLQAGSTNWTAKETGTGRLYRVSGRPGSNTAWAVGGQGIIVILEKEAITPIRSEGRRFLLKDLHSIFWNPGSADAWLVGDSGIILRYTDSPYLDNMN